MATHWWYIYIPPECVALFGDIRNVGKLMRMHEQCVPGLPSPRGRPGNEAREKLVLLLAGVQLHVLHIVGCGKARGNQWYQNYIHWTMYAEVINANYAVYSTRTDYSKDGCIISLTPKDLENHYSAETTGEQ